MNCLKKYLMSSRLWINYENDRLSKMYGSNYAFVKTYQDAVNIYNTVDKKEIERALVLIYESIKDVIDKDIVIVQGRKNFADSIKSKVTKMLLKEKIYTHIKSFYDAILNELYNNIQLFK